MQDNHSYFVGENRVLVHNCTCPPNGTRHKAKFQLRNKDGTFKQTGSVESGGSTTGGRLSWPEQQKLHTEGKILDKTAARTKPGDKLTIQGEKPACNMCKGAMNKAAKERGIDIQYEDSSGSIWNSAP